MSDNGAFDTVTRATVNHGLHRGSFQCNAVIKAENGKEYAVEYWTDGTTAVLTDGSKITFNQRRNHRRIRCNNKDDRV